jgi:hypothetical protein
MRRAMGIFKANAIGDDGAEIAIAGLGAFQRRAPGTVIVDDDS